MKAHVPVGRQVESQCFSVDVPAENPLEGGRLCVPFFHLLQQSGLPAVGMVSVIKWAKYIIYRMQHCTPDAFALPGGLCHEKKDIDVYINSRDR